MTNSISDFKEIIIDTALSNIAGCLRLISDTKNNNNLTDKDKAEYVEIKNMEISYKLESLFEYFKDTSPIMHFDGKNLEPFINRSLRNQDNDEDKKLISQAGEIIKQRVRTGKPKFTDRQKTFNVIYKLSNNDSMIKSNKSHFKEVQSYTLQDWVRLYKPGKTLKEFVIYHIEEKLHDPDYVKLFSASAPSTLQSDLMNMLDIFRDCSDAEFEELLKKNDPSGHIFKEIEHNLNYFKRCHIEAVIENLAEYGAEKKKILADNKKLLRKNRDDAEQIMPYFEEVQNDVKMILNRMAPLEKIKSFMMQKRRCNR